MYRRQILEGQLRLIEEGLLTDARGLESAVGAQTADEVDRKRDNSRDMVQEIEEYISKCKKEAYISDTTKRGQRVKTKNLVELRNAVIIDFMKLCSRGVKTCLCCSAPVRKFRQENQARIFMRGLLRKSVTSWNEACTREKRRRSEALEALNEEPMELDETLGSNANSDLTKQSYVTPLEVREHIRGMWANQRSLMKAIVGCTNTTASGAGGRTGKVEVKPENVFLLEVIAVPPSRFRPVSEVCSL